MSVNRAPLTVIGLGPMGQAMVRRYLDSGHEVTVWNRTPSRAEGLVAAGAIRAATATEAIAANELVLLSLTDYPAMYDILGDAGQALAGRIVVNLSSDTPEETRKAATWLTERGAELLVGGVMVPATLVGSAAASVFYSGPRRVFEEQEDTLRVIGKPDFRGEDHALAQLYYQAQLDVFLTALAAVLHGFALMASAGVSAETFAPYVTDNVNSLAMYLPETVRNLASGQHPGELANTFMMGATAAHVVGASEAAGLDTALPKAVLSLYRRAIDAGYGRDRWTALYEVITKGRRRSAGDTRN